MPLVNGTSLGPYQILAPLGAGGMGEVYRARDSKLNRDVAIKVLPDAFVTDPDRLARFDREAQALAALNHPNIGGIYGLEESNGVKAFVLELVDGVSLADRIAGGPIPLSEALDIARQMTDALEAAHEKGIVHRDLKPANVRITPQGIVKLLDFGLAAVAQDSQADVRATNSPTLTVAATLAGVIMGTAAYMSPEQAAGKPADKRADIWAFGVVLWEMLTGQRLFEGESISHTLAFVITREPDWSLLPPGTPSPIRTLLRRALAKDRKRRLADVADARFEIEEAIAGGGAAPSALPSGQNVRSDHARRAGWRSVLPWAVAAATTAGLAVVLALSTPWRTPPTKPPVRLTAELGVEASLTTEGGTAAVLSPDGQTLAFAAQKDRGASLLYTRRLDQLQATPVAGTEDAHTPFFSPDGQWIAFFAGGKLKKVSLLGGAAVTLADALNSRGGTWAEDDTIVFLPAAGAGAGLMRVSSAGGKTAPAIDPDPGGSQRWPQVLPGGKALLYQRSSPSRGQQIMVQPLPSGPRKVVQANAGYGRYLKTGHLVYLQEGTLFAAPFDLERLELKGQPVPVVDGVASAALNNGAQFAVSDAGTLVYQPGKNASGSAAPIVLMDRTGTTSTLRNTAADWSNPRFSPDGQRLAVDVMDGSNEEVAILDWTRDTLTPLTLDAANDGVPVWTPDGQRVVYRSIRDGQPYNLFWQRADGTGAVERLTKSGNPQIPSSWHPSNKFLVFGELIPGSTDSVIMILPFEGDERSGWKPQTPRIFPTGSERGVRANPVFSPDGRWLAYVADPGGRANVTIRPFPGPGGQWVVGSGVFPTWSRARHELLYQARAPDRRIMVVPYRVEGDAFVADQPRLWSDVPVPPRPRQGTWDLHPDGNRIVMAPPESQVQTKPDALVFVFNFFDELRRIAPARK